MVKSVLIIEDDDLLREIYATKLNMEGFTVDTAGDGLEGLEKARAIHPQIILLDMIMPRMTGIQFLEAFHLPDQSEVSVFVMSNKSSVADIKRTKNLGVIDYLIKSQYTPDQVVAKIRQHTGDTA